MGYTSNKVPDNYELPIASDTIRGGVRIGTGLIISDNDVLQLDLANINQLIKDSNTDYDAGSFAGDGLDGGLFTQTSSNEEVIEGGTF